MLDICIRDWKERCVFREFIREFSQVLVFRMMGYDIVELSWRDKCFNKEEYYVDPRIKWMNRIEIHFKGRFISFSSGVGYTVSMKDCGEYILIALDKVESGDYQEYETLQGDRVLTINID